MGKYDFHVTYRYSYDTDKSLFPVCDVWVNDIDNMHVYPFTIACHAIDDIIKTLSSTDQEMIIRAFARNMVGEFLYKSNHPINVRDFIKDTKYIFDALSDRQVKILRNVVKVWNEYDQKHS